MGNTANLALPYPENTDPLANMALAVKALAEAIDAGVGGSAGWTAVVFQNSWVNFGGTYQVAQYKKVGKRVYVRGAIKTGASGTVAFTLPAGYRPAANVIFTLAAGGAYGQADIATTGTVTITGTNAAVSTHVNFSFEVA